MKVTGSDHNQWSDSELEGNSPALAWFTAAGFSTFRL
jgi:hypothetical protein